MEIESTKDKIVIFKECSKELCRYRRDLFWIKQNDRSYYTDSVWPK